jgi:hypothetical protein
VPSSASIKSKNYFILVGAFFQLYKTKWRALGLGYSCVAGFGRVKENSKDVWSTFLFATTSSFFSTFRWTIVSPNLFSNFQTKFAGRLFPFSLTTNMLNYHALNPATAMRPPTRAVHGGPSTPRVRGGALPYSSISALNSFPPLSTSVNYQNNLTPTSTPHYPLDSTSFVTTADTPLNGHTWAGGEGGEKQYFIPPPKILGTRALPSLRIPSFSFSTVIPYTTMNHSTPIYQASTSNARYDDWMSSYTATSYGSTIDKRPLSATRSTFDSRDSLPTTSVPFPTLVTRIPSKASVSPSILPLFVPSSISRHVDYEEGRDEDQEEEEDNSEGEIEDATVERRITVDARRD